LGRFSVRPAFPVVPTLAHVHENYSRWAIPDHVKRDLWDLVRLSSVSPISSRHYLMLTVLNSGMISFASNLLCSLQLAGLPLTAHFFITLGRNSYDAMPRLSGRALFSTAISLWKR
jgi:hypothetical protein